MGKRCCCNPSLPCCCGDSPSEWIVDLGAGGWVDGRCDGCDEVQGEFVVSHDTTSTGHELTCMFSYFDLEWCLDSIEDCEGEDPDWPIRFGIVLRIPLMDEFAPTCMITAQVFLLDDRDEDAFCRAQCVASYEATFTKADFDGCFDEDFVPFTLDRVSNICTASNSLGLLCTSGLPLTITIRPNV